MSSRWAVCHAHDLLRPSKGQGWPCLQDTWHTEETAGRREAMQQQHAARGGESRFLPRAPGCRASLSALTPAAGSGPSSLEGAAISFRIIPDVLGRCAVLEQRREVVRGVVEIRFRTMESHLQPEVVFAELDQAAWTRTRARLNPQHPDYRCSVLWSPSGHYLRPPFLHSRAYSTQWLLVVFVNPFLNLILNQS